MEAVLQHYGIQGMHWGERRYQNPDGTLTEEGKARLRKYKEKSLQIIDAYYKGNNKNIFTRGGDIAVKTDRDKWAKELEIAKIKGSNDKKINKIKDNVKYYDTLLKRSKLMKDIEKRTIKEMKYDDMLKEKSNIGKTIAKDVIASIGYTALSSAVLYNITGGSYVMFMTASSGTVNQRNAKYRVKNHATEKEKQKLLLPNAYMYRDYNRYYR